MSTYMVDKTGICFHLAKLKLGTHYMLPIPLIPNNRISTVSVRLTMLGTSDMWNHTVFVFLWRLCLCTHCSLFLWTPSPCFYWLILMNLPGVNSHIITSGFPWPSTLNEVPFLYI